MAAPQRPELAARPVQSCDGRTIRSMAFLTIAFACSWSCWLLAPFVKAQSILASRALSVLGGFVPGVAAVAVIAWTGGYAGLFAWFGRCLQWRIGMQPFAWAVFLPLAVLAPMALVHAALGGNLGTSPANGHLPMAVANLVLILLLGGPLGEEFGWRGYSWPALRIRYGWRASSLIRSAGQGAVAPATVHHRGHVAESAARVAVPGFHHRPVRGVWLVVGA